MNLVEHLVGQRFERLVVESTGMDTVLKRTVCYCLCDCGKQYKTRPGYLLMGRTKSCGCLRDENRKTKAVTHGGSYFSEHRIWRGMKQRCYGSNGKSFKDYGGRGIAVCDEWRKDFAQFYKDMGQRPSEKHTIERVNNDLGYSKENCKWELKSNQAKNRRCNVYFHLDGEKICQAELRRRLNMSDKCVRKIAKSLLEKRGIYEKILDYNVAAA